MATRTDGLVGLGKVTAVCVAALLLVPLAVSPAEASVIERLTLDDLHARAEMIARGRVQRTRGVRVDGRIETETVLRIEHVWRGPQRRTVKVRTPGGVVGDIHSRVAGAPRFERGDTVLVFLYRDRRAWRTVGLFQGVWRLSEHLPGQAIPSPTGGAAFLESGGAGPYAWQPRPTTIEHLVGAAEEVRR